MSFLVRGATTLIPLALLVVDSRRGLAQQNELRQQATAAMRNAAEFYRHRVASHGGYVYHYSLDLSQRWGEGVATKDQIWIQPPGSFISRFTLYLSRLSRFFSRYGFKT